MKVASIAEKIHNPGYEIFFCNDGCLYHPTKHLRKHFIDYIYIFMHFQKEKYPHFSI
jgi:hypothetical protein